jgi:hypothetical protein
MGLLQRRGTIRSWRLLRRKLNLAADSCRDFLLEIEVEDGAARPRLPASRQPDDEVAAAYGQHRINSGSTGPSPIPNGRREWHSSNCALSHATCSSPVLYQLGAHAKRIILSPLDPRHERELHIVGGGMAGSEAAWQAAEAGVPVVLHEMRPKVGTFAHRTGDLAEMVCSNSFRSDDDEQNAVGLLHWEMRAAAG